MRGSLLILTVLEAGCFSAHGVIRSSGGALGSWTFTPDACRTGKARAFFGVELLQGDTHLSVVDDVLHGAHVVIEKAGARYVLDGKSSCRRFKVSGDCDYSGRFSTCNSGAVALDCDVAGGAVSGDLTYELCREVW
jgi:hypothetical protein